MKKFAIILCAVLAACLVSSCAKKTDPRPVRTPVAQQEPPLEHVIKYSGETLGLISAWYTGKLANWPLIVDANPGLRPERMNLGQSIFVPGELVVETAPLPESFVKRGLSAKQRSEEISVEVPGSDKSPDAEGEDDALLREAKEILSEEPKEVEASAETEAAALEKELTAPVELEQEAPAAEEAVETAKEEAAPVSALRQRTMMLSGSGC